jgi:urease accessory protein UreE
MIPWQTFPDDLQLSSRRRNFLRLRADHGNNVNLEANLEIREIHEKSDCLLNKQWEGVVRIRVVQLSEICALGNRSTKHSH